MKGRNLYVEGVRGEGVGTLSERDQEYLLSKLGSFVPRLSSLGTFTGVKTIGKGATRRFTFYFKLEVAGQRHLTNISIQGYRDSFRIFSNRNLGNLPTPEGVVGDIEIFPDTRRSTIEASRSAAKNYESVKLDLVRYLERLFEISLDEDPKES